MQEPQPVTLFNSDSSVPNGAGTVHGRQTTHAVAHQTRAIVKTQELLRGLSRNTGLTQDIRSYAKSLLRHYPSAAVVFSLGRLEEYLVNDAHYDEYQRRVISFHQPLQCSSLE